MTFKHISNLYRTQIRNAGLTGGTMCMGREVREHAQTRIFKGYFKWPCDNPKFETEIKK